MNASINPKSATAFTAKGSQNSLPLRVWCAIIFAALVFSNLPAVVFSQSPERPGIYVKVLGIRTGAGNLTCALFDSPVGFPVEFPGYATRIVIIEIQDIPARNDLSDIPPEAYEFAVIHAENTDDKLAVDLLEIPTEGYDFSNDLKTKIRPPSFSDAGFPFDGQDKELTISLHY